LLIGGRSFKEREVTKHSACVIDQGRAIIVGVVE
jgi:hypothetical protein